MSRVWHDRKVKAIKEFWGFYGADFPLETQKGNMRYFIADLIVDISYSYSTISKDLDCDYIWIEVIRKHHDDPEKEEWLPKMLSERWLILKYGHGEPVTPIRPKTYDGKMSTEETKDVLMKLRRLKPMLMQKLHQQD